MSGLTPHNTDDYDIRESIDDLMSRIDTATSDFVLASVLELVRDDSNCSALANLSRKEVKRILTKLNITPATGTGCEAINVGRLRHVLQAQPMFANVGTGSGLLAASGSGTASSSSAATAAPAPSDLVATQPYSVTDSRTSAGLRAQQVGTGTTTAAPSTTASAAASGAGSAGTSLLVDHHTLNQMVQNAVMQAQRQWERAHAFNTDASSNSAFQMPNANAPAVPVNVGGNAAVVNSSSGVNALPNLLTQLQGAATTATSNTGTAADASALASPRRSARVSTRAQHLSTQIPATRHTTFLPMSATAPAAAAVSARTDNTALPSHVPPAIPSASAQFPISTSTSNLVPYNPDVDYDQDDNDMDDHAYGSHRFLGVDRQRLAPALLANAGGNVSKWVEKATWSKDRNKKECESLAMAIDYLIADGVPADSNGIEVLMRRLTGVHAADSSQSWAVCTAIEFNSHAHSLLPASVLGSALRQAVRLDKLMQHGANTGTGRRGAGPRSSYNDDNGSSRGNKSDYPIRRRPNHNKNNKRHQDSGAASSDKATGSTKKDGK